MTLGKKKDYLLKICQDDALLPVSYTHLAIDLAIPRDIEKNKYVECIDFESLQQEIDVNNQLRQQDEICIHQRIKEEVEVIETKLSSKMCIRDSNMTARN